MVKARLMRLWNGLMEKTSEQQDGSNRKTLRWRRWVSAGALMLLLIWTVLGIYWSNEPDLRDVNAITQAQVQAEGHQLVVGYTTVFTLRYLTNTLLTKPGGYLSNDVMPPSVFLDNMPSWEFGVITQLRDLSRALRRDMTRSQSQSTEDADLAKAEPLLHFDHNSWILPSTEGEYRTAIRHIDDYLARLTDPAQGQAQFYARSDNLSTWLRDVETRLGSLSQRLSASVGQQAMVAGSTTTVAAGGEDSEVQKTPRLLVDNVFYEARGASWALIHILKAIETDFGPVLDDKNARVSFQQIIRELEQTQAMMWSPIVLNGGGFGVLANHSLVMANYISRANAAIIDLRELLERG